MKKVKGWFLQAVIGGMVILGLIQVIPAQAQTVVLKIQLRDSHGGPLSGVQCEVISYDWGVPDGQGNVVIARGVTNQDGKVAFDGSPWPAGGYFFRFTPTPQMQPANTYFDLNDQYRGYPAVDLSGQAQTVYFFIAADGLAYYDLSEGKGAPTFQRNPVGGLDKPRVSIMPAQQFLDTAMAQTFQAQARGIPTPTIPPKPSPFRGVQTALPLSPEITAGTPATTSSSTIPISTTGAGRVVVTPAITPVSPPPITAPTANTTGSGNLLYTLLLALVGVGALFLYFKYSRRISGLFDRGYFTRPRTTTTGKAGPNNQEPGAKNINPDGDKTGEEE